MEGQILSYATREATEKAAVSIVQEMKSKGISFDVVMDIALAGATTLSPAEVRKQVAAVYGVLDAEVSDELSNAAE